MKIAIVHDSLIEFGGAERIIASLFLKYPNARVYTSTARDDIVHLLRIPPKNVHVLPIPQHFSSHHSSLFQCVAPLAWRTFNLESYDVIVSCAGYLMANLVKVRRPLFIQYIHSPPKNVFGLEPPTPLQTVIPYAGFLRNTYVRALRSCPNVLTDSLHMQKVLQKIAGITATCIYPPVTVPPLRPSKGSKNYFLVVSRLDRSKSIELAIKACNTLKERLLIIGQTNEPAYERYLRRIAGPTINFLGFIPDDQKEHFYLGAKAFLFTPKNEDFGIAPVEAMARGVPVIAYYGGGAKETMLEGVTGKFFYTHDVTGLVHVLKNFSPSTFVRFRIHRHASQFEEKIFLRDVSRYIETLLRQ